MKKNLLIFLIISSLNLFAQTAPSIQWQKSLGGSSSDMARFTRQTADGGYIVAGYSKSNDGDVSGNHGGWDYWIVKLDGSGTIQWQKSFGGNNDDFAQSVQQTADGGYIVAGISYSNDGDVTGHHGTTEFDDAWILKLDSNGNIEWQKSLGGSYYEKANSVQQTTDGGYIIVGNSASNDGDVSGHHGPASATYDYWIVKLNSSGTIQWQKSLGGSNHDEAFSVSQTTDGGYIVSGASGSNDGDVSGHHGSLGVAYYDYWIVKLSSIGNIVWQKSLGGSDYEYAYSVQQTTDGGYIIAGISRSNDGDVSENHGGGGDYWIVKLNNNGNIIWEKSLGGSDFDRAHSIQQTTDGGYIIAGFSSSTNGDVSGNHMGLDYWLVKVNSNGVIQWQKSLGGNDHDESYSIQQTSDNGYIISGNSQSNNGDVNGNNGSNDYWIVKLSAEGLGTEENNLSKINIYPKPIRENLYFSEEVSNIKITDISGRMVKQISTVEKSVNVFNLVKGVYIISATTKSGEMLNKKIVKE